MSQIDYPCPTCESPVPVEVRTGTDWWTATCPECKHAFQLWRCPDAGHICTFSAYQDGDIEGLKCDGCGHRHSVVRVDDTVRVLRDALETLKGLGPQLYPLLRLVQGGLRMHTDQLNPERAQGPEAGAPYPGNRKARKIVGLAARAQNEGKLTEQKAARLMGGMR